MILFGHLGEGASFSVQEKSDALIHLIKAGVAPSSIIISATCASAIDTIQLINLASKLQIHGCLIAPPFYYKDVSERGLADYFDFVFKDFENSHLNIYLHLLPDPHYVNLSDAVIYNIFEKHKSVFSGIVNETETNYRSGDLIKSFGERTQIFSASELDITLLKATGTISRIANLIPRTIQKLLIQPEAAGKVFIPGMKEKKPDDRIVEFLSIIENSPKISAYKILLSLLYKDKDWSNFRPPYSEISLAAEQKIQKLYNAFKLDSNNE